MASREASAPGDSDATAKTSPQPLSGGRGSRRLQRADVVWKYDMFNTWAPAVQCDLRHAGHCGRSAAAQLRQRCRRVLHERPAPEAPAFLAFQQDNRQLIWSDKTPNPNIWEWLLDGSPCGREDRWRLAGDLRGFDGWLYAFDLECIQRGENLLLWTFDLNPWSRNTDLMDLE